MTIKLLNQQVRVQYRREDNHPNVHFDFSLFFVLSDEIRLTVRGTVPP